MIFRYRTRLAERSFSPEFFLFFTIFYTIAGFHQDVLFFPSGDRISYPIHSAAAPSTPFPDFSNLPSLALGDEPNSRYFPAFFTNVLTSFVLARQPTMSA